MLSFFKSNDTKHNRTKILENEQKKTGFSLSLTTIKKYLIVAELRMNVN